jgi:hypothetical protein
MIKLKDILIEGLGCPTCTRPKAPLLIESTNPEKVSPNMLYHVYKKLPITENTFRYGSESFLDLWQEARWLHENKQILFDGADKQLLEETEIGTFDFYNGKLVPIDLLLEEVDLEEADKKKKTPPIGKPKRGGSKKFYVYVRKPGGGVKKVSFGDTTGLSAKINNSKARAAFSKRHDCPNKKDRTKASYWSCRLPRYAKLLGLKSSYSGFW